MLVFYLTNNLLYNLKYSQTLSTVKPQGVATSHLSQVTSPPYILVFWWIFPEHSVIVVLRPPYLH